MARIDIDPTEDPLDLYAVWLGIRLAITTDIEDVRNMRYVSDGMRRSLEERYKQLREVEGQLVKLGLIKEKKDG